MRVELPAIAVTVDGVEQAASTTIATAGPYVVVATTLPDRVQLVTSVYLGDLTGPVAASHLHLVAGAGDSRRASAS